MTNLDLFSALSQQRWVKAYNTGDVTIGPFAPCEVVGFTVREKDEVTVDVQQPSTTFRNWYAVNAAQPIKSKKPGLVTFSNPMMVQVPSSGAAFGQIWGVKPAADDLLKCGYGFYCLGSSISTGGTYRAPFVQNYVSEVLGKTQTDSNKWDKGETRTGTIRAGCTDGSETSPGFATLTIYQRMADDLDISSSRWCIARYFNDTTWELVAIECP